MAVVVRPSGVGAKHLYGGYEKVRSRENIKVYRQECLVKQRLTML